MVGDDAGDDGFGNQLSIHGGPATHFAEVVAPAQDFHFDAQLIARDYRSAKLGVFDTGKVNQLFSRRLVTIEEDGSDLSHGLNHQHPRHYRRPGKVSLEEMLVNRDVFDAHDALGFEFRDAIHQEKGIPVGQNLHDVRDTVHVLLLCVRSHDRIRHSNVSLQLHFRADVRSVTGTAPAGAARNPSLLCGAQLPKLDHATVRVSVWTALAAP